VVGSARSLAIATWGLFVSLTLLMVAGGLFGTIIGVRAETQGFNTLISGAMGAAYNLGFLIGARFAAASLRRVGHIRVFAALASLYSGVALIPMLTTNAPLWVFIRLVSGIALAGLYVIAEAWLNDLANNANRGRVFGVYVLVTNGAFGLGQFMLNATGAGPLTAFIIASFITSIAVIPVALAEGDAPAAPEDSHISIRELARIVPTGVGACSLVGVAHGAITGLAAVWATRAGMSVSQIALFLTAPMIGGMLFQWPISSASDDLDRRAVGVVAATLAAAAAVPLLVVDPKGMWAVAWFFVMGGFSYPLYSIAVAYTNDWTPPEQVVGAATQLIAIYGLGAIVGPMAAAALLVVIGLDGFIWLLIGVHVLMAAFFVYRMRAWRSPLTKRPWDEVSLPARAFFIPATLVSMSRRRRHR
jgi:MFS family permease